jgi:Fe2+ transport system protein FeoA
MFDNIRKRQHRRHHQGQPRRHQLHADHADAPRLSDLRPGEKGKILEVGGSENFRVRLMEMGLTAGATIEVDKLAPLQDPMEFIILDYHLSLRRMDAEKIAVERV